MFLWLQFEKIKTFPNNFINIRHPEFSIYQKFGMSYVKIYITGTS